MTAEAVRCLVRDDDRPHHAYSREAREDVAAYAQLRREQGARWREIQEEVGVSSTSVRKWMAAHGGGFQQVAIVEKPAPALVPTELPQSGFTITSPSGFALTGCSLEQAAAILRRLR